MTSPSSTSTSSSKSSSGDSSSSGAVATTSDSDSDLQTSQGKTTIADSVVQKIAGIAAREISGVHELGSGAARAFGSIKSAVGGSSQSNISQGVKVEVGETQAAVDLNLIVEYGVAIADLTSSVRRNVISTVERMTGLEVTEVNISVDDIHLPSDDQGDDDDNGSQEPPRVQ